MFMIHIILNFKLHNIEYIFRFIIFNLSHKINQINSNKNDSFPIARNYILQPTNFPMIIENFANGRLST